MPPLTADVGVLLGTTFTAPGPGMPPMGEPGGQNPSGVRGKPTLALVCGDPTGVEFAPTPTPPEGEDTPSLWIGRKSKLTPSGLPEVHHCCCALPSARFCGSSGVGTESEAPA